MYRKIEVVAIIGLILLAVFWMAVVTKHALAYTPLTGADGRTKQENDIFADLQSQINQLQIQNAQLEQKVNQYKTNVIIPVQNEIPNNHEERITQLETRVGVIERTMDSLKGVITKTLELLTKLLKKI